MATLNGYTAAQQEFLNAIMPHALRVGDRIGVDPRIIAAQAAQETGWGKSAPNNNYFGIKSHGKPGGSTQNTFEYVNGQRVNTPANFRGYADIGDSVEGYGDFLQQNPRYGEMLGAENFDDQLSALGRSGYATDPNYASSVGSIARGIVGDDWGDPLPPKLRHPTDLMASAGQRNVAGGQDKDLMAEPEEEKKGVTFHPGMVLSSLGAALSASTSGEDATQALTNIRNKYFDRMADDEKVKRDEQARKAMAAMYEGNPAAQAAIMAGAAAGDVANVDQFNQSIGLEGDKLAQTIAMNNATIDNWGVGNQYDRDVLKAQNARWAAEQEAALERYNQDLRTETSRGSAAQELIASTFERAGDKKSAADIRRRPASAFAEPSMVTQFLEVAGGPDTDDNRTAKMKEWDHYNTLVAAGKPEEAEAFKEAMMAPQTSINMGDKAALKWTEADINLSNDDLTNTSNATKVVEELDRMTRILQEAQARNGGVPLETGAFQELIAPVMNPLADAGAIPKSWQEAQNSRQLIDQIGTYLGTLNKSPGSVSDFEQKMQKRIAAGLATPEEALPMLIEHQRNQAARARARAIWIRKGLKQELYKGGYAEASEAWDKKVREGDADTSPVYLNVDTYTPENVVTMANKLADNTLIQVDGKIVPLTPAIRELLIRKAQEEAR